MNPLPVPSYNASVPGPSRSGCRSGVDVSRLTVPAPVVVREPVPDIAAECSSVTSVAGDGKNTIATPR